MKVQVTHSYYEGDGPHVVEFEVPVFNLSEVAAATIEAFMEKTGLEQEFFGTAADYELFTKDDESMVFFYCFGPTVPVAEFKATLIKEH